MAKILGIIGGGQLGMMLTEAAKKMPEHISKIIVLATGYSSPFVIKGLESHIIPHQMTKPEKDRIQLKNKLHLVKKNLYVAGALAGWRSQFAIACGSGAQVGTDILTLWNNGEHTKVHDKK